MVSQFIPRAVFPTMDSLPRSYFLGHHRAGLSRMKTLLSSIDLVIECRDYRVPLTSRNPLFEESLAGRERLIVYTKRDLGSQEKPADRKVRGFKAWAEDLVVLTKPPLERADHTPVACALHCLVFRSQRQARHWSDTAIR